MMGMVETAVQEAAIVLTAYKAWAQQPATTLAALLLLPVAHRSSQT
jgi:hypothetical protein